MIQPVEWRTEYDCCLLGCLYTRVQRALKWAYLFIVPMLPWPRNAEDCYCAYMVSWRSTATVRFATLTAFVFFARVVQLCTGGTPGSLGTVAFALYSLLGSFLHLGVRLGYFSIFNIRNFVYRASHLVGVLGFACVIITDSGDAGISDILALGRTEDDLVEWGTTRANILVIPIFAQLVMSLDYWVPLLGNWALLLYYHENNFHETGFQGGITFVMIFCIEHDRRAAFLSHLSSARESVMYEAELVQNMKECTLNIFGADPEKLASQMNPLLRNSLTTFGILCSKLCPSPEIQESESLQDQVHLTATSINWTAANIDRWWSAMDFSGWGRHAFMPCRSACYLRDLLLDVGSLMHNAWFVREHVTLAFFLDPRLPKHVVGLDACVTQMILTLVHNACDCTFEGVVNVELTEGAAFNHCRSLHVKVTDTGIGVNQQCIPYLFDKCFSTKEGTGINLFVLKHQAAALMGTYGWNRRTGEELIDKKY